MPSTGPVEQAQSRSVAAGIVEALSRALYVASAALFTMLVILLIVSAGSDGVEFPQAGLLVLVPMVAAALSLQVSAATLAKPSKP